MRIVNVPYVVGIHGLTYGIYGTAERFWRQHFARFTIWPSTLTACDPYGKVLRLVSSLPFAQATWTNTEAVQMKREHIASRKNLIH